MANTNNQTIALRDYIYQLVVDYVTQVNNKPKINGVTLENDKSLIDLDIQFRLDAEQMDAVNSKITAIDKIKYDNYETQKQDKLTALERQVVETHLSSQDVTRWNSKQDALTLIEGYDPTKNQILSQQGGKFKWIQMQS